MESLFSGSLLCREREMGISFKKFYRNIVNRSIKKRNYRHKKSGKTSSNSWTTQDWSLLHPEENMDINSYIFEYNIFKGCMIHPENDINFPEFDNHIWKKWNKWPKIETHCNSTDQSTINFDSKGHIVKHMNYDMKCELSYSEEGFPTLCEYYIRKTENDTWEMIEFVSITYNEKVTDANYNDKLRYVYSFEDSTVIILVYLSDDTKEWGLIDSLYCTLNDEGMIIDLTVYYVDQDELLLFSKDTILYNDNNLLTKWTSYEYDDNEWFLVFEDTYSYDDNKSLTEYVSSEDDEERNSIIVSKYEFEYDENGIMTIEIDSYFDKEGALISEEKYIYNYYSNDNLKDMLYQMKLKDEIEQYKREYFYNEKDLPEKWVEFSYDITDSEWVEEATITVSFDSQDSIITKNRLLLLNKEVKIVKNGNTVQFVTPYSIGEDMQELTIYNLHGKVLTSLSPVVRNGNILYIWEKNSAKQLYLARFGSHENKHTVRKVY